MAVPKSSPLRTLLAGSLGVPPAGAPDEHEIAAWLEGRLSESEAARVEAWLAHNPQWRAALGALAEAPARALSGTEIARAHALLPESRPAAPAAEGWRGPRRLPARLSAWLQSVPLRAIGGGLRGALAGALGVALFVGLLTGGFFVGAQFGAELARRDAVMLAQILGSWPL